MGALPAEPGWLGVDVEKGPELCDPRLPDVVSPGELLLPPHEELPENEDELDPMLVVLLDRLLLLLPEDREPLLKDLEPPLDPRANTSPQRKTKVSKTTSNDKKHLVDFNGFVCMVIS